MFSELVTGIFKGVNPVIFFVVVYFITLAGISLIPSRKSIKSKDIEAYKHSRKYLINVIGILAIAVGIIVIGSAAELGLPDVGAFPLVNSIFLLVIGSVMILENHWKAKMFATHFHAAVRESETGPIELVKVEVVTAEVISTEIAQDEEVPVGMPAETEPVEQPSVVQTMEIACPQCSTEFEVEVKERPIRLVCPNCGVEGILE